MHPAAAHLKRVSFVMAAVLAAVPSSAQEEQQQGWRTGPGAQLRRPGIELRLTGYVQEDFRSFRDYEDPNGVLPELGQEWELRRLRFGVEAKWDRVSFDFNYDPHDPVEHLKNLFADVKISKALHLTGGLMKLPVSAEWLTGASRIDFIERNLPADLLAPGRDWGVKISGEPIDKVEYELGVFAGDGRTDVSRADTTVAGRLQATLAKGFVVGVSGAQGQVHADAPDAVLPLPRGLPFRAPSGFRFYERHFVDGARRRLGADARLYYKAFGLKLEMLDMRQERNGQGSVLDDLPAEASRGWSAGATWLITGGRKTRSMDVEKPIHRGGAGAIELGLRYDTLDVDDDGPDTGFAASGSRARNIRPVGGETLTGGLSWWPVYFVRLMANAVVERYDDPLLAPVPGKKGNYVTVLARLQFSVP
jgi:phosphate-selective porin